MDPDSDKIEFDTIFFDNGDYYEGDTYNGLPHGEGTMYYDRGLTVTGKWLYGLNVGGKRDEHIPEKKGQISKINGDRHTLYVGYGYSNDTIAEEFGVSKFIRGIRLHRDHAVLLSTGDSVYKDGMGWELDDDGDYVFEYTGEGLDGDQTLTAGNRFLKYSKGKDIFLFVKRKPNDYVFHGKVIVKDVKTATEKDRTGKMRTVFKFYLYRV